ncbi:MAG: TIGR01244 family phosphatase [Hyphomonadaceae bacterium]|nr:TIGR01244 family phosphatase [Hyphomonadaceae bacterium]
MSFQPKQLSADVSVSAQILPHDVADIKGSGFKSVIINRPDGEKPGQPMSHDLQKLLTDHDISVRYVPMSPGELTPELLTTMAEALEDMPKPILAFCASGTRSTVLWCFANVNTMGVDAVLNTAMTAGYNLEQIRPILTQLSHQ